MVYPEVVAISLQQSRTGNEKQRESATTKGL